MLQMNRYRVAMLLLVNLVAAAPVAAQPVPIIFPGMHAPGTSENFGNALAFPPVAAGHSIAVAAQTGSFKSGVWELNGDTLTKVELAGDAVSGLPGATYNGIAQGLSINQSGNVAFTIDMINAPSLFAVASNAGGSLQLVARSATAAPGSSGNFASFDQPIITNNGNVAFRASLSGGSSGSGIWTTGFGPGITLVGRDGSAIPGGGTLSSVFDSAPPAAASSGVSFQANANPGTLDTVWAFNATGLQPIASEHGAAPGVAGATFSFFHPPTYNDAGQVAFQANLVGNPTFNAIFRDLGQGLQVVAGNGLPAPSIAGAKFGGLDQPAMNGSGTIAFTGYLDSFSVPTNTGLNGIWTISPNGQINEVARQGNAVPDLPGNTFGVGFQQFAISNTGQLAWYGSMNGASNYALFAQDPLGHIHTLVQRGQTIQVLGLSHTVNSIYLADDVNGTSGQSVNESWTSNGRLVYRLTFTDGTSGIFYSTVPEPATWALVVAAVPLAYLACRGSRRARRA
jgi:hypothetical protein